MSENEIKRIEELEAIVVLLSKKIEKLESNDYSSANGTKRLAQLKKDASKIRF